MKDERRQDRALSSFILHPSSFILLRWLVCVVYVLAWTQALLTPDPLRYLVAMRTAMDLPVPEDPDEDPQLQWQAYVISKSLHVAAYALLAVLIGGLGLSRRFRWLLLVFMSLHAMGTEYGQLFVEGRHASWSDVGLDHVGIGLGLALSWNAWWRKP
jgi:VanZ family protein